MRVVYFILLVLFSGAASGQAKNPFLQLKFDKVIFYDFNGNGADGSLIVDKDGGLLQVITKEVQMDSAAIQMLNIKLGDKRSYGGGTAKCFDPHCGFVYYLNGKPVAQVTICLQCNRLYSSMVIPAQQQGKQGKGKEAYYTKDGLSKTFRQYINGLLIKNGFSHQARPGDEFDK